MGGLEKAISKRPYRERGQLKRREKFGLLEKHKDYVKRARNFQDKKKVFGHFLLNSFSLLERKVLSLSLSPTHRGSRSCRRRLDSGTLMNFTTR